MVSIPKIVSVLSYGVLLGLGLTGNAASAADKMKADQSSERFGDPSYSNRRRYHLVAFGSYRRLGFLLVPQFREKPYSINGENPDADCNQKETAMSSIQYLRIGLLALVFMGGCESTPTVTRTGVVKDIVIGDKLFAVEVSVNPGDEVRWVHKRTEPARIVFLNPISVKQLSCKNHFGGVLTPSSTANRHEPNRQRLFSESWLLPVVVSGIGLYGQINVPGVVTVGEQSTDQTSDSNNIAQFVGKRVESTGNPPMKEGPASSTSTTATTTTTPAM
jgi:hypothetical protein